MGSDLKKNGKFVCLIVIERVASSFNKVCFIGITSFKFQYICIFDAPRCIFSFNIISLFVAI